MAKQVVETNTMFTGSEAGKLFHRKLTTKQLDALIHHNWPSSKEITKQTVVQLQGVMQNIKYEQGDPIKKGHTASSKNNQVKDDGIEGTKDARLKQLILIGKKLRTEGFSFTTASHLAWK